MSARRAMPACAAVLAAVLAALLAAGCAGPRGPGGPLAGRVTGQAFPERADYAFGWAPKLEQAQVEARAANDADRLAALVQVEASICPSWQGVRVGHPLDAAFGNAAPSHARRLGCHTDRALDAMVARREDLAPGPRAMAPAPAAPLARGVTRLYERGSAPLPERGAALGGE